MCKSLQSLIIVVTTLALSSCSDCSDNVSSSRRLTIDNAVGSGDTTVSNILIADTMGDTLRLVAPKKGERISVDTIGALFDKTLVLQIKYFDSLSIVDTIRLTTGYINTLYMSYSRAGGSIVSDSLHVHTIQYYSHYPQCE